jgi:hypothetical protein
MKPRSKWRPWVCELPGLRLWLVCGLRLASLVLTEAIAIQDTCGKLSLSFAFEFRDTFEGTYDSSRPFWQEAY